MMMKIIGAALIVSGGYLLGKIRILQWNRRIKSLNEICGLFQRYLNDLSEYRASADEFFSKHGSLGKSILKAESIEGFTTEDFERLRSCTDRLKHENYQSSLSIVRQYIEQQKSLIKALEEETASSGKALPLVTGAIGLLVAVFLF